METTAASASQTTMTTVTYHGISQSVNFNVLMTTLQVVTNTLA